MAFDTPAPITISPLVTKQLYLIEQAKQRIAKGHCKHALYHTNAEGEKQYCLGGALSFNVVKEGDLRMFDALNAVMPLANIVACQMFPNRGFGDSGLPPSTFVDVNNHRLTTPADVLAILDEMKRRLTCNT